MEKEFVSYEIALRMKQLGFNEPCMAVYFGNGLNELFTFNPSIAKEINERMVELGHISCPTFSQAFRWLRENYELWFRPDYYDEMKEYNFQGSIHELGKYSAVADIGNHKSAEEAELACLEKLLEIVEFKKE